MNGPLGRSIERAAGFEGPLDQVRAIVLELFGPEGRKEYTIWMDIQTLVGERIEEGSVNPGRVPSGPVAV